MLYFNFNKRHMKKEKETLRTTNVIEMKGIVILMKANEMCNILKSMLSPVERNSHINVPPKQV